MPVRTPNGLVTRAARARRPGRLIARHGWRARWLRESLPAHAGRHVLGGGECVLGDIRWCVNELLASGADPLLIVNLDRDCTFDDDRPGPLTLRRREHEVHVTSGGLDTALHAIWTARRDASVLITGCTPRTYGRWRHSPAGAAPARLPPRGRILAPRRPKRAERSGAAAFREVDASGHGAGHRVKALDAAPAGAT